MDRLFHIPSLMLCLATAFVIVSIFLTRLWMADRTDRALVLWCLGFWSACFGLILLSLREVIPAFLSLGVGNAFSMWGLGLVWLGSLAFDKRKLRGAVFIAWLGGIIWLGAFLVWPGFLQNLFMRVVIASVLYAVYSLIIAQTIRAGHSAEPLPSRRFAVFAFGVHGLFYVVRLVVISFEDPVILQGHPTFWYGALLFEYFIQALFAALAIFGMVHERMALQYKRASELDFLTGLLNRRAFLTAISEERESRSGASPGAVLALIDADHFKQINDTHGHGAGDAALRMLADELTTRLPVGGACGRLGGEEFGVYLPASVAERNRTMLTDLLDTIRTQSFDFDRQTFKLTVSIGAAVLPAGRLDFNLALAAADRALYASKKSGRDCLTVVAFEQPATPFAGGAALRPAQDDGQT